MRKSRIKNITKKKVAPIATPSAEELLKDLFEPTTMLKIKNKSKHLERSYYIDSSRMYLCYEGSQKMFHSTTTKIKLSKLQDVRDGKKEFSIRLEGVDKSAVLCLVLSDTRQKVVYLLTPSEDVKNKWVTGLRYLIRQEMFSAHLKDYERWVKEAFKLADKNSDGAVDFNECLKLIRVMNSNIDQSYVKKLFNEANTDQTKMKGRGQVLDEKEFVTFYINLTKREEVLEIFSRISHYKGYLTVDDLYTFLTEIQKCESVTKKICLDFIKLYESDDLFKTQRRLSFDGFSNLLSNKEHSFFNHHHTNIYQDMSQPIQHYFINSSHNTYLIADQLRGPSSTEAYIQALRRGCRCVELDCWDGPGGEPIIYHGYTLTSKIKFEDVINVINNYAFETSEYPLILSFENHCSMKQQIRMAEILQQVLQGQIYVVKENSLKTMPSPDELKKKIVIKCKKLPSILSGITEDDEDVSDEDEAADIAANEENIKAEKKAIKKYKLAKELSDLVAICRSFGFKGFDYALNKGHFSHISSLSESKCEKLCKESPTKFARHTDYQLVRTYPNGSRTDSSNYNPVPMWCVGCQIVALNFQTQDVSMQINHGRFLPNGHCGYVLKPDILLNEQANLFNPNGPFDPAWKKTIEIKIISGYQIPKVDGRVKGEIIDPFVQLELFGVPADNQSISTKYIKNNGLNPIWNQTFTVPLNVPQLAMLLFTIYDYDGYSNNDFIGYFSLPFTSIQQGYRQFRIYNKSGVEYEKSLILVHVVIHSGHYELPGTLDR